MNDLDPYDFDQTKKGWASFDEKGDYLNAAKAIESYIKNNPIKIKNQNRVSLQTLYFHAGQEYAMAGPAYYVHAIKSMMLSYKNNDGWNAYVDGSIAFLKQDTTSLKLAFQNLTNLSKGDLRLEQNAKLLQKFLNASNNDTYAFIYDSM